MAQVEFKNVVKKYDKKTIINNVNLTVNDKEFLVLVGSSGCGKSTLLRMVAGLEEITDGEIFIDGKCVNNIAPKDRDIAFVFQNYALYPHMSVYDNIAFPLKMRKMNKTEIDKKVQEAAQILNLTEYLNRKPKQLSGGQRQRVALGRAIVRNPKVFLMDEPLSNLDAKLRVQMRSEIKKLHEKLQTTFIYVTHDQTEALTMGDRIAVIDNGIIQQTGNPIDVYKNPDNKFVGGFLGSPAMNFIKSEIKDGRIIINGSSFVLSDEQKMKLSNRKEILLGIRPETFDDKNGNFEFVAPIEMSEMLGSEQIVYFKANNENCSAVFSSDILFDKEISLKINTANIMFFDCETNKRI